MRKLFFRVSDQVRHKQAVQPQKMAKRFKISDLGSRGIVGLLSVCSENKGAD